MSAPASAAPSAPASVAAPPTPGSVAPSAAPPPEQPSASIPPMPPPPRPPTGTFAYPSMPALPLGGPPPEVLVSPEHMHAYAANCRRTLHYAVNGTLLAKRDHILHQIGRLRAKMLEVAHVRGVMERDIQSEASEALQRLASAEALKQMKVQREVDELARHADAINVLAAEVEAVTSAPDAMSSEFLGRYRVRKVSFVWHCRFSNRNRNRISPPGAAVPSADAIPPDVMPARAPSSFVRRRCTTRATA